MRQDDRARFDRALQRARTSAYAPGEFVGQESFVTAGEVRDLGVRAGIGASASVLDLCCGVAGPGRFLTRELGCTYLGVDANASAVAIARERAADLPCRFAVAEIPPLPSGPFDVVLLLETMLAFEDKDALLGEIFPALRPGGRFAFTLEEGQPLTAAERAAMPAADTVRLVPLEEMLAVLERAGLAVAWREDHSGAHRAVARALADAFAADADDIAAQIGRRALDDLLAAHRLWIEWLDAGRVRKFAIVAERPADGRARALHRVGCPAVLPDLGLEDEVLHDDPLVGVGGAGERTHRAPGDPLDRRDELIGGRDLEEHARLAHALLLAHVDHRAFGGKERVVHDAEQRVGAGQVRLRLGRAAPELILVQGDHRVGHVLQQPSDGLLSLLRIGGGVGHDRPSPLPLRAGRKRGRKNEDPQAATALRV